MNALFQKKIKNKKLKITVLKIYIYANNINLMI